ncbi:MAG: DUF1015 domain-containing protein, partial [Deltaproteobacteria bacterium]|nr:DUF1015 domain-containing protein [Deltaproteobacteria bacterium]
MADIASFRGLRYDLSRVGGAATVLAPPYDVVSEPERAALEARDPHNVIRLELPRGDGDTKYQNARQLLEGWTTEGILRTDDRPAIYVYEQQFRYAAPGAAERSYARRGFFCRLRLEPFTARVVLPHENTLAAPKEDRRKLMTATRTHLSQIFGLYRDPDGSTAALLGSVDATPPALDGSTADGCRHRLWPVTAPETIAAFTNALVAKQIMIADGHHRYETMLAVRDEVRPPGAAPGTAAADWGCVFLARAEDPGLLVLPTHRLVRNLPTFDIDALRERATGTFDITIGEERDQAAIEKRLVDEGRGRVTFAVHAAGKAGTVWMGLRADADLSTLGPAALRGLDVSVLHGLVLGPMLGIDAAAMARQAFLGYTHDTGEALDEVASGRAQAAFLMNATPVDQVLSECEAGFVLPQKSTYFQP